MTTENISIEEYKARIKAYDEQLLEVATKKLAFIRDYQKICKHKFYDSPIAGDPSICAICNYPSLDNTW